MSAFWGGQSQIQIIKADVLQKEIDPLDGTQFLGRFFNSENWKVSPYMSTVIPAFFLSMIVSLVDYSEEEMKALA
jgi:hypothetical protein